MDTNRVSCDFCEKSFKRMWEKNLHTMAKHAINIRPFTCIHCEKSVTRKDSWIWHERRRHKDLPPVVKDRLLYVAPTSIEVRLGVTI